MPSVVLCLTWLGRLLLRPPLQVSHIGVGRGCKTPAANSFGLFGRFGLLGGALLGSSQLGGVLGHDDIDRTASLLDRRDRALRRAGDLERQLGRELALAEQTHAVLAAARDTRRLQRRVVDHRLRVELLGVDQLLHLAEVHLGVVLGERVVEAALRQAHVERHLAALEALDGNARTALLALLAAAAGLALARADAASDADAALAGAGIVPDIVQFHVSALAFAFVARKFSRSLRPCAAAWRSRHEPRGCPRARRCDASCPGRARSGSSSALRAGGSASRSA